MPTLLAAPDKFRGTVTAREAAASIARGASSRGWSVREMPLADGGEGLIDALAGLGGVMETVEVEGPLGQSVEASWLHIGQLGIVEMAQASGLALVGGAAGNDPLRASTRGTGELILAAVRALRADGVTPAGGDAAPATIVVGLGGSATTDGGRGAYEVIDAAGGLGDFELVGACDVTVGFLEAASKFGPQKGATPDQVGLLEDRLRGIAQQYREERGIDVESIEGAGAAGGFGGAIAALGGTLRSGYEVVTDLLGFATLLGEADLVVTGEGALDATSLLGKVVGCVLRDSSTKDVPVLVIAGRAESETTEEIERFGARVVSLSDRFGEDRAMADTARCIEESVADLV
jgi:glycerate 2-kinase